MAEQLYYVQDTRQIVGNCVLWWCPDSNGYTTQLNEAGLYTRERVLRMRDTDRPWPKELVESCVVTHVRQGHLVTALGRALPWPLHPRDCLALLDATTNAPEEGDHG